MSFFFPSLWSDDDDFFEPYTTLSQFLGNLNEQNIHNQKVQQRKQCGCFQKPHKEEEDEGAMSDGEVVEAHQKREEEKKKMEEKQKEEEKAIADEIARIEKEIVLVPAADVVENDSHFIITMNMPGLKKDDIHVSLEGGMLTVSAERAQPCSDAKTVLCREIPHGKMERQFEVPKSTKPGDVQAKVEDGVLTITIKKTIAEGPRKIEIA